MLEKGFTPDGSGRGGPRSDGNERKQNFDAQKNANSIDLRSLRLGVLRQLAHLKREMAPIYRNSD